MESWAQGKSLVTNQQAKTLPRRGVSVVLSHSTVQSYNFEMWYYFCHVELENKKIESIK